MNGKHTPTRMPERVLKRIHPPRKNGATPSVKNFRRSESYRVSSFEPPLPERFLTVYHFRGHDSLSLAVSNGIVLWGASDQTGTGYRVPLAFESDIRSELSLFEKSSLSMLR
jgi:hypothetical protein